ncbi:polyphenol oxidase family protein [Nocardioides sp. GY 10113]|uniref:polyphenol oxidase family protein n=1 Tax=Nocardioides sp. GY 10113 TaxID=2569761 RepID=UPI0010A898F8|nr:polyphenol oxidase family protein [Nocardioides sp. GY 10113]TIC88636.1 polyphenol oxidase family protein [Nocardioides sp. GY 10113]
MFAFRDQCDLGPGAPRVEVAFTDASVDLAEGAPGYDAALALLEAETGVRFARMRQVHGVDVCDVDGPASGAADEPPTADAVVTGERGTGLMVRVADCVPVLLADPATGVVAAVHAGRLGTARGVVPAAVARMRERGATDIRAWVGPHVCGGCYEVPEAMRAEVAAAVPAAHAVTRWGTPALDLGAGVAAQLADAGVPATVVPGCTLEEQRFHSHRRDGERAGRMAGLVWWT